MGDNVGRERTVLKRGVEVGEGKVEDEVEEEAKVDARAKSGRYDTCV